MSRSKKFKNKLSESEFTETKKHKRIKQNNQDIDSDYLDIPDRYKVKIK